MTSHLFSSGDLVFDIGANIGDKAEKYSRNGATVVCFEPQPHCVTKLVERFKSNDRVIIVPKGVAEKPGTLPLSICDVDVLSTFSEHWKKGRFSGQHSSRCVEVEVTTLDLAILEFGCPRYCKIDVEGYELNVLLGLTRPVDVISFEFTYEFLQHAESAIERLMGLGMSWYNLRIAENEFMALESPVDGASLVWALRHRGTAGLWGDVFAFKTKPIAADH